MCWNRRVKFLTTTTDENYLIDGVNIFEGFDTEKKVIVRLSYTGKRRVSTIIEVQGQTKQFKVAIEEIRFCVYAIYMVED